MTNTVLEVPAHALPHDQDLPPEALVILLHRELTRLATALDGVSDLEEAEDITIPGASAQGEGVGPRKCTEAGGPPDLRGCGAGPIGDHRGGGFLTCPGSLASMSVSAPGRG
jgi:hypothetical protein